VVADQEPGGGAAGVVAGGGGRGRLEKSGDVAVLDGRGELALFGALLQEFVDGPPLGAGQGVVVKQHGVGVGWQVKGEFECVGEVGDLRPGAKPGGGRKGSQLPLGKGGAREAEELAG
jgi:hypothetical protein